jgi:glycosyltransferase involved in cell wall biosynthesis
MTAPYLSVIIPVLNERENILPLYDEIRQTLQAIPVEVIFVDDGSTDGSAEVIEHLANGNPNTTAVLLARNFGQTAALAAGFKETKGEVVAFLDADGQNDPADISKMLEKMKEGYDVVSGWRRNRQDPLWSRRIPSALANRIIALMTSVSLHDFGCTLKLYRRSSLENIRLYGEMHRLLPVWCDWRGSRIVEMEVHHRPRTRGKSKYGIGRTYKVLLDLLTSKFVSGYLTKPSYVFGGSALFMYVLALISTVVVFYDKLGPDRWAPLRIPLLLLASLLGTVGTLLLMMGLLAELIVRLYYEVSNEQPYRIRKISKQI